MLINCPECNKEVSDKAEICPNCGFKINTLRQGVYCPKCLECETKTNIEICPYCHTKFKDSVYGTFEDVHNYTKNHPELKRSPEFSYDAYSKRINYVPYEYPTSNAPKCPTCGSLNVEKISTGKKIFGGAMFGLFSSDVRNTMHCKNCGRNGKQMFRLYLYNN